MKLPTDPTSIILMGVSGSGKTTTGHHLAKVTGFPFFDGDDYHPSANIKKMSAVQPLTAEDRIPWITKIIELINENSQTTIIIACSALTQAIRNRIKKNSPTDCAFIYLKGSYNLIKSRLENRGEHYMKTNLLASQFKALEEPNEALTIDIEKSPDEVCKAILTKLCIKPRELRESST